MFGLDSKVIHSFSRRRCDNLLAGLCNASVTGSRTKDGVERLLPDAWFQLFRSRSCLPSRFLPLS